MSIFKGRAITVEITGESHAPEMRVICKGFPEFEWDNAKLADHLARRKPSSAAYSTKRSESDTPHFQKTDGGFCAVIYNSDVRSGDYAELVGKPRPSHADYAWYLKDGQTNFAGGGRFSARLTAPLCVAGGIALQYLESKGVRIAGYVRCVGGISGLSYRDGADIDKITELRKGFPSLSQKDGMIEVIERARAEGDSVGGAVDCVVSGLKGGIGDCLFDGLEGKIASLVFAVPAVKGIEFGCGFGLCAMRGSQANDGLRMQNGDVALLTNRAGGINGGISNGADITLSVAFRPTPSISKPQQTVDLVTRENTQIAIKGRHDACVVPRAVPCVESAVALALLDEILGQ